MLFLGYALIAAVFIFIFAGIAVNYGLYEAILTFIMAGIGAAIIIGGCYIVNAYS